MAPPQGQNLAPTRPGLTPAQGGWPQRHLFRDRINHHGNLAQRRRSQHPIHSLWQGPHGENQGVQSHQAQGWALALRPKTQLRQAGACHGERWAIAAATGQGKALWRQGTQREAQALGQLGRHHRRGGPRIEQQSHGATDGGKGKNGRIAPFGPLQRHKGPAPDPASAQGRTASLDQGLRTF